MSIVTANGDHDGCCRLATEREEVQRQREYISKMRADFKPDGRQDDSTEEGIVDILHCYNLLSL